MSSFGCSSVAATVLVCVELFLVVAYLILCNIEGNHSIYYMGLFHVQAFCIGSYIMKAQLWEQKHVVCGLWSVVFYVFHLFTIYMYSFTFHHIQHFDMTKMYSGYMQISPSIGRNVTDGITNTAVFEFNRALLIICTLINCYLILNDMYHIFRRVNRYKEINTRAARGKNDKNRYTVCIKGCIVATETRLCRWCHIPRKSTIKGLRSAIFHMVVRNIGKFFLLASILLHLYSIVIVTASVHLGIPTWTYYDSTFFLLILAQISHLRIIVSGISFSLLYYLFTFILYWVGVGIQTAVLVDTADRVRREGSLFVLDDPSESFRQYQQKLIHGHFTTYHYTVTDLNLVDWFGRLAFTNHWIDFFSLIIGYICACTFTADVITRYISPRIK